MVKRQVLTRFSLLSAVVIAVSALGGALAAELYEPWLGWTIFFGGVGLVALAAYGCFTPNAPLFGRVISGGPTGERVLALTFDDGPSADTTPRILDTLRDADVRATFFVLGKHADAHPEIVARMRAEGHEIASHGYDHALLTFARRSEVTRQLDETEISIATASGAAPERLFRAPHGFRSPAVRRGARARGYRVVGWTKGVWDTALPGAEKIVERCVRGFRPGAILLLHDADGSGKGGDRGQTADALPHVLSAANAMGYRLVPVSELAELAAPRRLSALRIAAAGLVVVVLGEIALRKVDTSAVRAVDIAWWWVAASLIANFISAALKGVVWKFSLDAVPGPLKVRFGQLFPALWIGFLLNSLLVARLGEIARISVLYRRLRLDGNPMRMSTIAGTVVTEQVVIGMALAIVLVGMASVVPVPNWALNGVRAVVVAVLVIGLALVGLELLSRYRRRRDPADRDLAEAWWRAMAISAERLLQGLMRGQQLYRDPPRASLALGAGLVSWLAQITGIYWALSAFGIHEGVGAAALVFMTTTLVQLFPVLPANIGIFQGAVYLPLVQAYGVGTATALAFSIGLQLIEMALGAGLGFFFLWREGLSLAEARHLPQDDEVEVPAT